MANLYKETDGRTMPAEEICPDADINFKRSVNRIVVQVGTEKVAKAQKRAMDEAKRNSGGKR